MTDRTTHYKVKGASIGGALGIGSTLLPSILIAPSLPPIALAGIATGGGILGTVIGDKIGKSLASLHRRRDEEQTRRHAERIRELVGNVSRRDLEAIRTLNEEFGLQLRRDQISRENPLRVTRHQ